MRIDLLSLFPDLFTSVLEASILGRARARGLVDVRCVNIRDFAEGRHQVTDDAPYGGGAGMVMKVEPIVRAIEAVVGDEGGDPDGRAVLLLSASGQPFVQAEAQRLSELRHLVLIAGHYEGVDQRVADYLDGELNVGDYVLTGGELPALIVVDAVTRLLPGVVGNAQSVQHESFVAPRLEHPHYTRPAEFAGDAVPPILLSGDHRRIAQWREQQGLRRTAAWRPDLIQHWPLSDDERAALEGESGKPKRGRR